MLEHLRLDLVLDEFLVLVTLHLSTCLRQLSLRVDLVRQVHPQEFLLLLLALKVALNLIESLLGAEMRLVVEGLDLFLGGLDTLLLCDLVADEVTVSAILLDTFLVLESLLTVHVVNRRVELRLLRLATLLNSSNFLVEASKSLLVDSADGFITAVAFVRSVVVHGEGALRAQELWHARVVFVRNFLAVKGCLHFIHLLKDARRGDLRAGQRHAVRRIHDEALSGAMLIYNS